MRILKFTILLLFISFNISAQIDLKKLELKPKPGLKLRVDKEGGSNGSAVAWAPKFNKYYALIAGNESFPFESFDETGKYLETISAGGDLRGLWFNPIYEMLESNSYDFHDIISFETTPDGLLIDGSALEELFELPITEPQAVLCLNTNEHLYAWYDNEENKLYFIDTETGDEISDLKLTLPVNSEKMNYTTVVYTGIEGGEFGLLNFEDKLFYLFSQKTGQVSATVTFPKEVILYDAFNFSFANGQIFIFDKETRIWTGFKIVK